MKLPKTKLQDWLEKEDAKVFESKLERLEYGVNEFNPSREILFFHGGYLTKAGGALLQQCETSYSH